MSLIIHNITSCSSKINFSYLETDRLFGFDIVNDYTIDVSDVSFTDGSGVLWEGIEALKQAYLAPNLVARIGTDEFINGRVKTLSFGESAMVGATEAKVTIEESKRLDDYSNNVFAQNLASPQWIESFEENYSFSRSEDTYSSTRNVSISYKQDAGDQFLNNARLFLKNFYFDLRPNFGFQVDGISEDARIDSGFKPLITEEYDLIGLRVSLTENFNSSKIENNYSRKESYVLSVLETGFLEKKYSVEIKALKEPLEKVANDACAAIIDGLIASNPNFGKPVDLQKGINGAGGVITLDLTFTTDPSRNQSQTLSYTCQKTKRGVYYDYSLTLNFASDGKNEVEKFESVKTYWKNNNNSLTDKVLFLFPDAGTMFSMSDSVNFQKFQGKIDQTTAFTTDPSYDSSNLPDGILKQKTTYSIKEQNRRISTIFDVSDKHEKGVVGPSLSIGEGTITTEVVSKKSRGIWFGVDYLNSLNFGVNHINSDSVSFDTSGGTSSRVINYVFTS